MTTPEGDRGKTGATAPDTAADGRVRRPAPTRGGPIRENPAAGGEAAKASPAAVASAGPGAPDAKVSDAVAHAVKMGYDVIAENIRQGREAAQRFRQGEYALRDAPGDIEVAALRLLHLARELSTTTFDVCERLLKELGAQAPSKDRAAGVPGFRPAAPAGAVTAAGSAAAPPPPGAMAVTVRFEGAAKATSHTDSLARPRRPTGASGVTCAALAPASVSGAPIAAVRFELDASVAGIVAVVTVPDGQAPGFYSGVVLAQDDPIPLGVLTIEIAK